MQNTTEERIIEDIERAEVKTVFVIVDLEGMASMVAADAISRADLVCTLCQGLRDEADEVINKDKEAIQQLIARSD